MDDRELRLMELENDRGTWQQILMQTSDTLSDFADGWATNRDLRDALDLRDRCRDELARVNADIAKLVGLDVPISPEKVGDAIPERVIGGEDAIAELSEVASDSMIAVQDIADAVAELSQMFSDEFGGE